MSDLRVAVERELEALRIQAEDLGDASRDSRAGGIRLAADQIALCLSQNPPPSDEEPQEEGCACKPIPRLYHDLGCPLSPHGGK